MSNIDLCIRQEDTDINPGERRTPLLPEDIKEYTFSYEPWDDRIISLPEGSSYPKHHTGLVAGIKPCAPETIQEGQTHLMFSHVIKGQQANMPLLQRFVEEEATLIDYECLRSKEGKRLLGFGYYAGLAGTLEGLIGLNMLHELCGNASLVSGLNRCFSHAQFNDLSQIVRVSSDLKILIVGSGQVALGAIEACRALGLKKVTVSSLFKSKEASYANLSVSNIIQRIDNAVPSYKEYLEFGSELYKASLAPVLERGKLSLLVHGAYWDKKYPRLLSSFDLSALYASGNLPEMIADITCDPGGSFACTTRDASLDQPFYEYDFCTEETCDGLTSDPSRVKVMAVSNLPSLFPYDASKRFSNTLKTFLPELISFSKGRLSYEALSPEIKGAVIVHKGWLTPPFGYLEDLLCTNA